MRGKEIFSKSCANCHRLNALGHAVGPDLAALKDRSSQAILIAVLDPNRAVENKYLNYAVETEDGLIFTGMLADETTATITLRGPENKEKQILRNEIETLTATGKSIMPEGMEKDLTPANLADVIAYLQAAAPASQ